MQKLQRHCSLALQLLRSVRTTSSTAKIHLFLLPSRGKSGSKSHPKSGSRKGDEICWEGSTSTKISCTNTFSSGILESELWFKMSWLVQKSTSWKFHILNFTALSLQKVFQQCLLYKQKKSNTCLRAVWWRFRDLNTNESHFYEKEAIGHSFTRFCCLKSQETNLLMKFGIPAWCQATTRSCKLNFKLKGSDLCLVRTIQYDSMFLTKMYQSSKQKKWIST